MPFTSSALDVPWYNCVPAGTVAMKKDMPLWLSEEPHWRVEEWMALKMWFVFSVGGSLEAVMGLRVRSNRSVVGREEWMCMMMW
jgi:hypothetical protein